ncbi:FAD-binding oxidoreductase [Rhodococcus sp. NCIMB 12038]|uniref:NAD(P)/FAD-dependent oxidoreductase n=1 Tax=Rhodococcus sp. NCIMB 12038 TaxID=933800 RepID=UPI000B3CF0AF|nr:FAD-binding oxidoreductase [Rhodococcus sp. NCIMB 12038]OUS94726.1 FAD-dependent oxidoreductase [Rhodococcus sp. NCIMB 12038]
MTTTSNTVYSTFTGWIDPPTDVRPPLTEDLTCRVAVIGGGLAGMSTALRLAERGVDTVLLEAEFCGYGSASRNAGQLASAPGGDIQLLNLFFRKRMPAIIRLTENAAHHVEDLIETLGIDCDYEPTGNVFTAVSRGQMGRVRRVAKILRGAGAHVEEGSSRELGVPHGFVNGLREVHGGIMNPGKFTRGLRGAVLSSSARVFEQSKVADIARDGAGVVVSTPRGVVRAQKVVLATNAFAGEWDIAPKRLSSPMWVVEVETEPIDPERLAALGWTSRSGLVTQHNIMENYRLTSRNTIVCGVRRIERGKSYPLPEKSPDPALVAELADAFARRFPTLADVAVDRAWGGWIAITSTWLPIAGKIGDDVFYSVACNGHGLAQAPYLGSLIADLIVTGTPADDLRTVWIEEPKFARPMMMGRFGLRTVWAVDRVNDLINGSRRNARKGFTAAQFRRLPSRPS